MQDLVTFLSNHVYLSGALAVVLILVIMLEAFRSKHSKYDLSPTEVTQLINHENAVVVDIRPQEIYRKGHIIDAHAFTINDLSGKKIEKFKNKPIVVVDGTGHESQKISTTLRKQGYNSYSLLGGMRAWSDAQMPILKE